MNGLRGFSHCEQRVHPALAQQFVVWFQSHGPGKIIFVVVTDGQENASREFDRKRVNRLVMAKKHLGWDFVFLSADLGAFEEAGQIGVDHDSRLYFEKSAQGNDRAWAMASMKISERRSGTADKVVFDDSDRQSAAAPQ